MYNEAPPGFKDKFGTRVCRLQKSLYGLKQSPKAWFERFTRFVKTQGYNQGKSDHTMFVKHSVGGKLAILIVYVYDIILTRNDVTEIARMKRGLAEEFEIKDLEAVEVFPRDRSCKIKERHYDLSKEVCYGFNPRNRG